MIFKAARGMQDIPCRNKNTLTWQSPQRLNRLHYMFFELLGRFCFARHKAYFVAIDFRAGDQNGQRIRPWRKRRCALSSLLLFSCEVLHRWAHVSALMSLCTLSLNDRRLRGSRSSSKKEEKRSRLSMETLFSDVHLFQSNSPSLLYPLHGKCPGRPQAFSILQDNPWTPTGVNNWNLG